MTRVMPNISFRAVPSRKALVTGAIVGFFTLVIAGCDHGRLPDQAHIELSDPTRRHPISVVVDRAELDIGVRGDTSRNRALANLEATRFARTYTKDGRGPIVIEIPGKFEQRHASFNRVRDIQTTLEREGIPAERVRVRRKPAGQPQDTITMSYDRIAAVGPVCGDWSENLAHNPQELPHSNFGCATQRNLAHMIANPTDLSFPAREADRGSDRRTATHKAFSEAIPPPAKIEATRTK